MQQPPFRYAFDSPAAAAAAMVRRCLEHGGGRGVERCAIDASLGRILGVEAACDRDSPAFDYSSMDGFAVRTDDLARAAPAAPDAGVVMAIAAESVIGRPPPAMPAGAAVRIATGAAVPPGADAVVRRESVEEIDDGRAISLAAVAARGVKPGDFIRRRGENARAGEVVLPAGSVLTGASLAVLASIGVTAPLVRARLRVSVISTGDEIVPVSRVPGPFEVRNANAAALGSMLGSQRWLEVVGADHAADDAAALEELLRRALGRSDAVVISGGASVGHRDAVREVVERVGADIVFHGLPQRPGKPMLGAVVSSGGADARPVFGLPGNPVSALVTCTRIVLPVLGACAGAAGPRAAWAPRPIALACEPGTPIDLWWHRLVRLDEDGRACFVETRGSGDIISAGNSDGFVEIPPRGAGSPNTRALPFFSWPG